MDYKFILIRHSQSSHNHKKSQHRNKLIQGSPNKQYKKTKQFMEMKFSQDMIDPSQIDQAQVLEGLKDLDFDQIGLIIVSPLNRCLQTVKCMKQKVLEKSISKQFPPTFVQPLITSRISTAWSTSQSLCLKKQNYPEFNYSQFTLSQSHWQNIILNKTNISNATQCSSILTQIKQGNPQSYTNIMRRIRIFKTKLRDFYDLQSKGKIILILGHSCLFKYVVGQSLSQKGKVDSNVQFQHFQPHYFTKQFILQHTYLKPHQTDH